MRHVMFLIATLLVAALAGCGAGQAQSDATGPVGSAPSPQSREQSACEAGAPAQPPLADLPAPVSGTIKAIELDRTQATRLADEQLRGAIHSRVGTPLDAAQIAADVARLWALGEVDDVQVHAKTAADGLVVTFAVTARPLVGSIFVRGGDSSSPKLQQMADGLWRGNPFDEVAARRHEQGLAQLLQREGYYGATVGLRSNRLSPEVLDVCVVVDRGPRGLIDKWEVVGNKSLTQQELSAIWATDGGRSNAVGGVLMARALEADLVKLKARYLERGHLAAKVDQAEVELSSDGTRISVTIEVQEGPLFRIGEVTVRGPAEGEYAALLSSKAGEVFSRAKMTADIDAIKAHHERKGEQVEVLPEVMLLAEQERVNIVLSVR